MEEPNSPVIAIGGREVGATAPVFVIAEIGINHNGSVELAKEMISAAKWAGADAVKFQKRTPEITTPDRVKNSLRQTPWGEMTYLDYKNRIEFWDNEYNQISDACDRERILWSASAWDLDSADFLEAFGVPFHKLASAHLTNVDLREKMNSSNIPLLASTGMATWIEVEDAVRSTELEKTVFMHSTSVYPAAPWQTHLTTLGKLRKIAGPIVGYSGHEEGISISLAAVALGAKVIERHLTLDRNLWGTDQKASLEPGEFQNLVRNIREVEASLSGAPRSEIFEFELVSRNSLKP